jgi:hypothetical protein
VQEELQGRDGEMRSEEDGASDLVVYLVILFGTFIVLAVLAS